MRFTFIGFLLLSSTLIACGDDAPGSPDASLVCTADSQCDDAIFCNGPEQCSPGSAGANALGCVAGPLPCEGGGACIETDSMCDTTCAMPDGDGDGVDRIECGGNDCDDTDAERFPGNAEICDADDRDEDCDPNTVGAIDRDGDGFIDARCANEGGAAGTDCNDLDRAVTPVSPEACNLRDDDCDGNVDEGVSESGFADTDADGRGDNAAVLIACPGAARFALIGDDCDDADLSVQPVQNEICDTKDNDCDGDIDEDARPAIWYEDTDGDGYGDVAGARRVECVPPAGFSLLPTDCAPGDPARSPVAVEICNGLDDDCNGVADFVAGPGDLEDDDRDGLPDVACGGGDCDDLDPLVGPGLPEVCNGRDDDCDGMVDEGLTESDYFEDRDGDGYGTGPAMPMCADLSGFVPRAGDCNDLARGIAPGTRERCDNIDDDCDGMVDEGASASCSGPNATYTCVDGFCEVAECMGTFGDCDLRASTGCETDLSTTANSCGLCGAVCPSCAGGFCPGGHPSEVVLNSQAFGPDGTTPAPNMPVFAPLTFPVRTTTTDMFGFFNLTVPGITPIVIGGGNCYPTMFQTNGFGIEVGFGPFAAGSSGVRPLDSSELDTVAPGQRPDRGVVVVYTTDFLLTNTRSQINLGFEGPIGTNLNRPFGATGEGEISNTSPAQWYRNVEAGPLEVQVDGCTVSQSPGVVVPGALTIVRVTCPAGG